MTSARQILGNGADGTEHTLALISRWKDYYSTLPAIRHAALIIAGSSIDDDQASQVSRLAAFVMRALVYQADPVGSELIQSPDLLLAQISETGSARGDCDDHVCLFCTLCESLGIACDAAGVLANGSAIVNHVVAVAHLPAGDFDVDLCAKYGPQPVYPEKLIVST